ncbi:MAG TPA: hypothetical protein VMT19_09680 [Thermoanaerobaculaceae bacterium]|nr:hypothetical protein [Thermoanaerobaculaceae bacterium]
MRRALPVIVLAVAVTSAVLGWWRWWTAPPSGTELALASLAALVPSDADGVLFLADPARAARWAAGREQVLALVTLAAPAARTAPPELRNLLAAVVRTSPPALAAWWRGPEIAAAAPLGSRDASALGRAAALTGTLSRVLTGAQPTPVFEVATSPALFAAGRTFPAPPAGPGRASALCFTAGRWWRVEAARSRLEISSGAGAEPPPIGSASIVTTQDLGALGRLLGAPDWLPRAPARLAFGPAGWAVALDGDAVGAEARRLLALGGDVPAEHPPGARHWRGVLGDVWVVPGRPLEIASSPSMLETAGGEPPRANAGALRGADLAAALTRLAHALETLPMLGSSASDLRAVAASAARLRLVRWRVAPQGGRVVLEW